MEVLVEAGDLLALDLVTKVEGEARVVILEGTVEGMTITGEVLEGVVIMRETTEEALGLEGPKSDLGIGTVL